MKERYIFNIDVIAEASRFYGGYDDSKGFLPSLSYVHSRTPVIMNLERAQITLEGLEYLEENSMMKKVASHVMGIVENKI